MRSPRPLSISRHFRGLARLHAILRATVLGRKGFIGQLPFRVPHAMLPSCAREQAFRFHFISNHTGKLPHMRYCRAASFPGAATAWARCRFSRRCGLSPPMRASTPSRSRVDVPGAPAAAFLAFQSHDGVADHDGRAAGYCFSMPVK